MVGTNKELQDLTHRRTDTANAYGMEATTDKSSVMANANDNNKTEINMNEEVSSSKCLVASLSKDGSCMQASTSGSQQRQWTGWTDVVQ